MSSLSQLFAVFESVPADELRLTSGEIPYVLMDGKRRSIGAQSVDTRFIIAAASEVMSHEELEDLPLHRPRVVRHAHRGDTWLIEVARAGEGVSLVIRSTRSTIARVAQRRASQEIEQAPSVQAASGVREAVGAGLGHPADRRRLVSTERLSLVPAPAVRPRAEREAKLKSIHPTKMPVAPRLPVEPPPAAGSPTMSGKRIDQLLRMMIGNSASDLHLSAGNPTVMRIHGEIQFRRDLPTLTASEIEVIVREIMTPKAVADFAALRDADFGYEVPGLARFRVNVFQDRNGVGAVLRQIPIEIRTLEELGLPKACIDLCYLSKGLVLVTGPTGSGKSTTLAAMIDYINKNRSDHIITIEDPVEFIHPNYKCLVNQREVGEHTKSFKNALRAALREDPDIVLVGEMRDLETVAIAIETAETGHLVFGTLHTTTAVSTVDRIIDQFPSDRQAQIRVMLSESLKGVIAQGLCKKIGGGRVAAHEILLGTSAMSALIRDCKTFQLPSVMQMSKGLGMVTMNDSLFNLVQNKFIEPKEAYIKAVDKAGLVAMFKAAGLPTTFS